MDCLQIPTAQGSENRQKQGKVNNTGTKALPENRTGVCDHHRNTYISYHNSVWGTKVKQPQLQGELSCFSYAFSIVISR